MLTQRNPLTKTEHVYESVRRDILDGVLKADQRLRLAELAMRYQTSPMPVREALRMLHRDGLIYMHNHRGAMVSSSSPDLACKYAEVRGVLETSAAELATPFHTQQSIENLRVLHSRLEQAAKAGHAAKWRQLNHDFHAAVCAPCPNDILLRTLEGVLDQIMRMSVKSLVGVSAERMKTGVPEHEQIVNALAKRDAKAVGRAMKSHADETVAAWRRIIESVRPAS